MKRPTGERDSSGCITLKKIRNEEAVVFPVKAAENQASMTVSSTVVIDSQKHDDEVTRMEVRINAIWMEKNKISEQVLNDRIAELEAELAAEKAKCSQLKTELAIMRRNINDLPDDCLIEILRYVKMRDVVSVCPRWTDIVCSYRIHPIKSIPVTLSEYIGWNRRSNVWIIGEFSPPSNVPKIRKRTIIKNPSNFFYQLCNIIPTPLIFDSKIDSIMAWKRCVDLCPDWWIERIREVEFHLFGYDCHWITDCLSILNRSRDIIRLTIRCRRTPRFFSEFDFNTELVKLTYTINSLPAVLMKLYVFCLFSGFSTKAIIKFLQETTFCEQVELGFFAIANGQEEFDEWISSTEGLVVVEEYPVFDPKLFDEDTSDREKLTLKYHFHYRNSEIKLLMLMVE